MERWCRTCATSYFRGHECPADTEARSADRLDEINEKLDMLLASKAEAELQDRAVKRFVLFAGCKNWRLEGGWNDMQGSFPTLEGAIWYANSNIHRKFEWAHVVDLAYGEVTVIPLEENA